MYAIVETGGKQYRVREGDIITVEKLPAEAGDIVKLDRVMLIADGDDIKMGRPYIEGAAVSGKVVENGRGPKIIVFKYKAKKDYRKKQGHRQPYTMIEIQSLTGEPKAAKAAEKKADDAGDEVSKPVGAVKKDEVSKPVGAVKKEESRAVSASMKKDELLAYAREHGIEVDARATKAVIIETIEAAGR